MRYVVRCHNCSHGDLPCDELRDDQRCPHCQSVPASYTVDGVEYCWLHREQLSGSYPISANSPFTEYTWRGHESQFPNAKLYEAFGNEPTAGGGSFCPQCQALLEQWLATARSHWVSE